MRIITSLSKNRVDRQKFCIQSWLERDCKITAVQTRSEVITMKKDFPEVEFIETDRTAEKFGRPNVRISAILDQCLESPGLILNSDIHISCSSELFHKDWLIDDNMFKVGIRWDQIPMTGDMRLQKYGIDAFLITPDIARNTPDIGMAIGIPAWDYWLPFHVVSRLNKRLVAIKNDHLIHAVHPPNWDHATINAGLMLIQQHYDIDFWSITRWIQRSTGRSDIRNWIPTGL